MALPETQKDRCTNVIQDWHSQRVTNINNLALPDVIKDEMADFSSQEEARQLNEICGLDPKKQITKRVSQ